MEFEILPGYRYVHDVVRPLIWLGSISHRTAEFIGILLVFSPVFAVMFMGFEKESLGWIVCIIYSTVLSKIHFNYSDEAHP